MREIQKPEGVDIEKTDPNHVGWLAPFDSDVELSLDQVSQDPGVRGKIRWMCIKLVEYQHERVDQLKADKAKLEDHNLKLRKVNGLVTGVVGDMECRGDEDCDHCDLAVRLREALNWPGTECTG